MIVKGQVGVAGDGNIGIDWAFVALGSARPDLLPLLWARLKIGN